MPIRRTRFERVYSLLILTQGVDGLLELVCGLVLLVAPRITGGMLEAVAAELAEGTSPLRDAAARSIASAGGGVVTGAAPLATFLLVHAVVKLVTVRALLRRAVRWYPWAIAALTVLLGAQIVDLVAAPQVGGAVLGTLDVVVILVVGWEYRRLRAETGADETAGVRRPPRRPGARVLDLQGAEQR
jgi:uncharacterized membrane protein